jgi:hypothetical protein
MWDPQHLTTLEASYGDSFTFFLLYLRPVAVHSANVVTSCRSVLTSTLLYLTGSETSCDLGSETYRLKLDTLADGIVNGLVCTVA